MKKKQLKKSALILMITGIMGVMINACSKNDLLPDLGHLTQKEELSIEEAQQWYNASQSPVFEIKPVKDIDEEVYQLAGIEPREAKTSKSRPVLGKPNWERAKQSQQGRYAIVEMPIRTRGKMLFMDEDTQERFDRARDAKYITNSARMVIQKDLQTGEMKTFIYVFIGSYEYLKKSKRMHKNTYFKREKDFEGSVLFYDLDGTFVNGWGYREGKIVTRISPLHSSDVGSIKAGKQAGSGAGLNAGIRKLGSSGGGALNCTTAYIPVMSEGCEPVDVYGEWDDELGEEVTHIDYDCDPKWDMELVTSCDSDGGDSGSGSNGSGSGGYNGGNNNPTTPPTSGGGVNYSNILTAVAPVVEINLAQRSACFNTVPSNSNTTYNITLHAHRGIGGGNKPGHAFITLEKSNGSNTQRLSYGFYPLSSLASGSMLPVPSTIGEESGDYKRKSDARYSLNISATQFQTAINASQALANQPYDLNDNNCVHYATDVFNSVNPPTGQIGNSGFIIPDDLHAYMLTTKSLNPDQQGISIGRTDPPQSTNCN